MINTRALILCAPGGGTAWYLHLYDGWLSAPSLDGTVTRSRPTLPDGIDAARAVAGREGDGRSAERRKRAAAAVARERRAGHLRDAEALGADRVQGRAAGAQRRSPARRCSGARTRPPTCWSTRPNGSYFVLLSGRWFKARSLTGPWTYVPSQNLPVDFVDDSAELPRGRRARRRRWNAAGARGGDLELGAADRGRAARESADLLARSTTARRRCCRSQARRSSTSPIRPRR